MMMIKKIIMLIKKLTNCCTQLTNCFTILNKYKMYILYIFVYIIIYMIACVVINYEIPINLHTGIEILKNFYICMGILKYKVMNTAFLMHMGFSNKYILGINTETVILITSFILYLLITILINIKIFILHILVLIFINALLKKFYRKHFWFLFSKKKLSIKHYIKNIYENISVLLMIYLKQMIIVISIAILIRASICLFLDGSDDIISIMYIIVLPLPIFFYLLNITLKKINKKELKSEDFYLFNDFVIERVNIYRILYVLLINFLIRNYYYIYISVAITVFILIIITVLLLWVIYKPKSPKVVVDKNKPILLEAKSGLDMLTVLSFIGVVPFFQEGTNKGFMEYYDKPEGNQVYWPSIYFTKPSKHYIGGETVNILNKADPRYTIKNTDPKVLEIIQEHKLKLDNSPILNMVYYQKTNPAAGKGNINLPFSVSPINFFSHKDFYGSVVQTTRGRILIVTIIRRDSTGSIFMPSFYLPDGSPNSQEKIAEAYDVLERKYNIIVPKGDERRNGFITFTQAESIDNKGLFKVWRPSISYMEPSFLREQTQIKDYFKLKSFSYARVHEFDYITEVEELRRMTQENTLETLKQRLSEKDEWSRLTYIPLLKNEFDGDRLLRKVLMHFFEKGLESTDTIENFFTEEDIYPKDSLSYNDLYDIAIEMKKEEVRKLDRGKEVLPLVDEMAQLLIKYEKTIDNNSTYRDNHPELDIRRDYHVDRTLWNLDFNEPTYFRIHKTGVLEGFKTDRQSLGKENSEFFLPLAESRKDLIETLGKKYASGGKDYTINLKSLKAVCVNRLTFELFEIVPSSNKWGYLAEDTKYNCEIYSIIDTQNNNINYPVIFQNGDTRDFVIPKHDYHFYNSKDEHSIRKFMDYIYYKGSSIYKSHISNEQLEGGNPSSIEEIIEPVDRKRKISSLRATDVDDNDADLPEGVVRADPSKIERSAVLYRATKKGTFVQTKIERSAPHHLGLFDNPSTRRAGPTLQTKGVYKIPDEDYSIKKELAEDIKMLEERSDPLRYKKKGKTSKNS